MLKRTEEANLWNDYSSTIQSLKWEHSFRRPGLGNLINLEKYQGQSCPESGVSCKGRQMEAQNGCLNASYYQSGGNPGVLRLGKAAWPTSVPTQENLFRKHKKFVFCLCQIESDTNNIVIKKHMKIKWYLNWRGNTLKLVPHRRWTQYPNISK